MALVVPTDMAQELMDAQDEQSRHPIVSLISEQRGEDIPFDGIDFQKSADYPVKQPSTITHSSGKIVTVSVYGIDADNDSGLAFAVTDVDRLEFFHSTYETDTDGNNIPLSPSICEIDDGVTAPADRNVGCVYLKFVSSVYKLFSCIFDIDGNIVTTPTEFKTGITVDSKPTILTLGTNSYVVVYPVVAGGNYSFNKMVSVDFINWTTETALSISGLTITWSLRNPYLLEIVGGADDGDLWLWFDAVESVGTNGEELTNLYSSVSDDSGITWGTATQQSTNTNYADVVTNPVAIQRSTDTMDIIYNRFMSALHMTTGDGLWTGSVQPLTITYDPVEKMMYVINATSGSAHFYNVVKINVTTWLTDDYWNKSSDVGPTSPSFPIDPATEAAPLAKARISYRNHIIVAHETALEMAFWYLDGATSTIWNYYLSENATMTSKGWAPPTVTYDLPVASGIWPYAYKIAHAQVIITGAFNRIYLVITARDLSGPLLTYGYIDIDDGEPTSGAPVAYTNIFSSTTIFNSEEIRAIEEDSIYFDIDGGYLVCCAGTDRFTPAQDSGKGHVVVLDIETGAEVQSWDTDDLAFPYYGIDEPFIYDGIVYGRMHKYINSLDQQDFRGLVQLNINTGVITLSRPSYCEEDDHLFARPSYMEDEVVTGDPKILMSHPGYGVVSFNTVTRAWERWSNETIPNFTSTGNEDSFYSQVAYNELDGFIMAGVSNINDGALMFHKDGYTKSSYYRQGSLSGTWSFPAGTKLVAAINNNYDAVAAVEPSDTSIFAFWENDSESDEFTRWDKDGSSTDLTQYIIDGTDVSVTRTIDGNPASLSFTLSHGYLFDPYNTASVLSIALKKGRKLALRWGENISSVNYWSNAGDFFVTSATVIFDKGTYPTIKVDAFDQQIIWKDSKIMATELFDSVMPNILLEDILETFAGIDGSELSLPVFGAALDTQWLETTIGGIISQVCSRFGYFFRMDIDGLSDVREITNTAATDHTYSDSTKITGFTPDDRFSDNTNSITVIGQEASLTQVIYQEERVGNVSGTLGWWGQEKDHTVHYSEDKSRRCVYPRMDVVESATGILFDFALGGKVTETLLDNDSTGTSCTVEVEAPSLVPELIAFMAIIVTGLHLGDETVAIGSLDVPVGKIITNVGLIGVLTVLGSVANYQIDVYGQPLGSIRRSVQAEWEDVEHQSEIGSTVFQSFEDSLCHSANDCQFVADFEGMVVQLQRKRVIFSKITHLQDEEGDTIQFVHPYGGQPIKIFVTDIKRTFKKSRDGYFLDDITGWVL